MAVLDRFLLLQTNQDYATVNESRTVPRHATSCKFAAHVYGASLESRRVPLKDGPEDDLPAPRGTFVYATEEHIGDA